MIGSESGHCLNALGSVEKEQRICYHLQEGSDILLILSSCILDNILFFS